jgi:hypothetical protein
MYLNLKDLHQILYRRGGRGIAPLFLDLGAIRGGWAAPRPGRFTRWKDPVPIVQEAGWAPQPVWMGAKDLAPQRDFFIVNFEAIY